MPRGTTPAHSTTNAAVIPARWPLPSIEPRRTRMGDLFCFVLFALQLSVCLWWHDYRRDDFPTLKFGVVMADLARHLLREGPFALSAAPAIWAGEPGRC